MAGVSGFGSTFTFDGGASANIISISMDGAKLNTIDTTTIAERHRTYTPGVIDSGTITVEANYDTAGGQSKAWEQISITAATTAPVAKAFSITAAGGYSISGNGILTDFSTKIGVDAALTVSFTVKVTGALTISDGA